MRHLIPFLFLMSGCVLMADGDCDLCLRECAGKNDCETSCVAAKRCPKEER